MRWHHAYVGYNFRLKARKQPTEHVIEWWDTERGEREVPIEVPENFYRYVLDLATRDGWELVSRDTHSLIFKKPAD